MAKGLKGSHQKERDNSRLRDEVDRALRKVEEESFEMPIGSITMFGGTTAPDGWLFCDGKAVSRRTYAELFKVTGAKFGDGDGASTFNLPDFSNRLPIGPGLTASSVGDTGGATTHSHDHSHSVAGTSWVKMRPLTGSPDRLQWESIDGVTEWDATDRADVTSVTTATTADITEGVAIGGATASDNTTASSMPPVLGVNFIIYAGV